MDVEREAGYGHGMKFIDSANPYLVSTEAPCFITLRR